MGDMKTPDFDDLLAAFDIPDIEAIQSSPEEDPDVSKSSADVRESGSPSGFPGSHVDPPVVSVIVKNTVRPEPFDELEKSVRDETKAESPPSISRDPGEQDPHFPYLGPKLCAASLPQVSNGVEGSIPAAQAQSSPELWPPRSPLTSTPNVNERGGSVRLKPTLHPQPSISAGSSAAISPPSSTPSSPHTGSPLLPPPLTRMDEIAPLQNPPMSPLSQNGAIRVETLYMDEEDSEPDLGSPLVIQESPESVLSSPPKFTQRATPPELRRSPETSSPHFLSSLPPVKMKPHFQSEQTPTTKSPSLTPLAQSPKNSLPATTTSSTLVQEKYPDHVIDERDSPESPPPSETGTIVPKRSSSPDSALTAPTASNHKDFDLQEDLRETELSLEERPKKMKTEGDEKSSLNAASPGAAKKVSSAPRRLKVKIKTPAGNITRTLSGVAPKRGARASPKSEDSCKPSPARRNVKTKRQVSQLPRDCIKAVLEGVRVAKDKTTKDTKPKLSTTAVNITKTTSLPSVAPSPRLGSGAIQLHSQGQRAGSASSSSLLSSQSSNKPASIVNNTGAIISRSQTILVEAFNKILNNKNLLPSYKPDLSSPLPAEWGLPLPEQGYRCLECGDAFALQQSLARHYDRRSLRIEVTCNHCAKRLAFFNKCSLLLHAREHKEKGLVMQCSHLVMKPVPVEQMIGLQEPKPAAQVSSSLRQAAANHTPQSHQAACSKMAEEVRYVNNKCPECQVQFSSSEEVADHFQDIKAAHTTSCTECSPPILLPNSCSAAAHQRIHQGSPPHVCPECGGTAKQSVYQSHLDDTCLHFARRIGFKCSSCLVVFGGLNAVKSHIQQAHCDTFHKCPSCPMAFKSAPSIQNHITAQHATLTGAQATLIYKCVMCDTVFTHKTLLHTHFETHLANQKVSVFKCPECTKIFSLRNSLMEHFKSHQGPTLKQEFPPSPAAPCSSRPSVKTESSDGDEGRDIDEERVNGERMKAPSAWKCVLCHTRFTVREDFIAHMAEQHGKFLKKFPCNKCESSFTTTSSMRRHIRDKHKTTSRGFTCQLCPKTFSSVVLLENHMHLKHSSDGVNDNKLMGGEGQPDEGDSASEQDGSFGTRQRRRAAVKVEHEEESIDAVSSAKKLRPSSSSAAASAHGASPQPESGFRCSPCGFTTEDQAAFLDHISQHRPAGAEGVSQQCLQCGACFTSTSSLSRHRFIIHKVRNVLPDNQQSPCEPSAPSPGNSRSHDNRSPLEGCVPASPSSQTSISHGKEEENSLACKVCRKQFDKASDLNTHFRTHGMAFINARNAGKST